MEDFCRGHYFATMTVHSNRRNIFCMKPGEERLVGTLVSGSRSQIQRFEDDCRRIVEALAAYDEAQTP